VIGKDTRLSGYLFENALTAGLVSMGADVILVGPMPSPAIAHLTKSLDANVGIVISASHNPADDNGIKLFSSEGIKLPDETEEQLEHFIFNEDNGEGKIIGDKIGRAKRVEDARGRYIEFIKSTIRSQSLEGLKIVLDCANGASYIVAPAIFQELGAEVIVIGNSPNGLNINRDCGALHPEQARKIVLQEKADIGITLDGDADRAILIDEKGNIVDGDAILAIAGLDMLESGRLSKSTVVATQYSNMGLEESLEKAGARLVRVKNGDRYVIEEMLKKGYSLGGEQSGHIIFGEHSHTGDGTLAALKIIEIMKRKGKKLSELASIISKYPQTLLNVKVREKKELEKMPYVMKAIDKAGAELAGKGRLHVRYSGTEKLLRIMVEAKSDSEAKKAAGYIADAVREEIGAE
jgi:phosphoglucosamine mutase